MINDDWAVFLAERDFLVGVSIDGPRSIHDTYRVDKGGKPTFDRVIAGLDRLKAHGVRWNALTTVHHANEDHALTVYRFLRDDLGADFIQLIPIVERPSPGGVPTGSEVTERSASPSGFGRFLIEVFDEWVRRDVGTVFVQMFDSTLASFVGAPGALCVHARTCGTALALEHNGDLYSCDHFVEPDHLLGNITETHMLDLVASPKQQAFGNAKLDTLPDYCLSCDVRFACNGGCPKDRFTATPDGQPGLHYLCPSYQAFFRHVDRPMRYMTGAYRMGRNVDEVRAWMAKQDQLSDFAQIPAAHDSATAVSRVGAAAHLGLVVHVTLAGDVHDDLVDGAAGEWERCDVVRSHGGGVVATNTDPVADCARKIRVG